MCSDFTKKKKKKRENWSFFLEYIIVYINSACVSIFQSNLIKNNSKYEYFVKHT